MTPNTDAVPVQTTSKKPRLALAIATVLGVGYAPKAPGTFGSAIGVILSVLMTWLGARRILSFHGATDGPTSFWRTTWGPSYSNYFEVLVIAAVGVYASNQVSRWVGKEDPQYVVIDEVSGQLLTYSIFLTPLLNWKTWLLGFLLFRLFDIWKPYPIRLLEKLPGGWGIMADDWLAGIYAAIVLRLAVHLFQL